MPLPEEPFVIFVARTPYDRPSGKIVHVFEHNSLEEWFKEYWDCGEKSLNVFGEALKLDGLFNFPNSKFSKQDLNSLENDAFYGVLGDAIKERVYCTGIHVEKRAIEVLSDDDEMDSVFYWFTSDYLKQNRDRLAYLVHEGWLPAVKKRVVESENQSKACTYVSFCYADDSCDTENWDIFRIEGSRLESLGDIAKSIALSLKTDNVGSEDFLSLVEDYPSETCWKQFIGSVVSKEPTNRQSEFQCSKHVCELYQHRHTFDYASGDVNVFGKLIVFDDIWLEENKVLGASIFALKSTDLISQDPRQQE